MAKISVVINTINEEENLPRAISSIKGLADEIVVVDMHSTDDTVKIAKRLGVKVFSHERTNYVEPARNFAIAKATGEWILVLDADEEIEAGLIKKLKQISESSTTDYLRIPRKNIVFGKWMQHSRWWPDYNIRFFKKDYVSWNEVIHSVPMTTGEGLDLETKEENAIIHHHYQTVDQFVERLNRYTTIQAKMLRGKGYKFNWRDIVIKPSNEFLSRFFAGEGYKDGIHGLALSSLQAFSEAVLYLKIWELEKFEKKDISIEEAVSVLKQTSQDGNYWQSDALVKKHGRVIDRVRRKFKI